MSDFCARASGESTQRLRFHADYRACSNGTVSAALFTRVRKPSISNRRVPMNTEVLIAGAGPTGLVLALWLTRLGVKVRIIDKTAEAGMTSRALAVQARTLEFYSQLGLAESVVERGRHVLAANLWVAGEHVARA